MTNTNEQIAKDAARASQLVKQTAEQTATALNIQYIQRDISDMKSSIEKLADNQDGKIKELECQIEDHAKSTMTQFEAIARIVYTGVGIAMAFSLLVPMIFKFGFK